MAIATVPAMINTFASKRMKSPTLFIAVIAIMLLTINLNARFAPWQKESPCNAKDIKVSFVNKFVGIFKIYSR